MVIETKKGSATSPRPEAGHGVIIAHLANNVNAWGAGFVLAVNDLSLAAKFAYKALCKDHNDKVPLGTTQFVEVKPDVWVANMIAQNGVNKSVVPNGCLVDYPALIKCLMTTFERAIILGCNVHIPSGMGSGLAGGSESMIHGIIRTCSSGANIASLEKQMGFIPKLTLWEFQDTAAASYVGPANDPKQAMVDGVFGTPDNSDGLDIDSILDDL